jgi:hypothetical protein
MTTTPCNWTHYRVSKTPFGKQRKCVRCLTHEWVAYENECPPELVMCPIGAAQAAREEDEQVWGDAYRLNNRRGR